MKRLRLRFGDVVLLGRTLRGWTQRDLSRESGVSYSYLSQLESGKVNNPTIDIVRGISDAFGCTPGALLDRCEIPIPTKTEADE